MVGTATRDSLAAEYYARLGGSATSGPEFRRGDVNGDGAVNLIDSIALLNYLFVMGTAAPACQDAADIDDNSAHNLVDVVQLLNYTFVMGSAEPVAPGPLNCGPDADTTDNFPACVQPICP